MKAFSLLNKLENFHGYKIIRCKATEEEAFISFKNNLNQIYANNVYGYSQKLSMDSLKSYTDITIKNLDNPEVGEWNVHGATIGEYRENKKQICFLRVL